MTARRVLGVVLIVLGIFALATTPVTYITREEQVGPADAAVARRSIPLLRIVGGIAAVAGLVVLVTSVRDRS